MRIQQKKLLIFIVGVLLLVYGSWQSRDFLRGPRVYLESPSQGSEVEGNLLEVKGQAFDVIKFTLNGKTLFTDEDGNFYKEVLLAPGVNNLEIYAQDKFGHEKKISRTVYLKN